MIIYFDMDGVLTNFRKRIEEYKAEDKKTDYEFWTSLEELPIKGIVNLLKYNGYKLGVISMLPSKPTHIFDAALGKPDWLQEHYSGIFEHVYYVENNKAQHCKPGDILIDNKQSNIDAWNLSGGIGIYFDGYTESSNDLLDRLKEVLK